MGNAYRSVLASGGAGTPITPSNSSPVSMTGGETYTPTTNGVAVESVTNLTPANTSPPSLSTDTIYKPTTSGKAIASIATDGSSVTPSSSGKYFYAGWNKMESSGYAYSNKPSSTSLTIKQIKAQFTSTGGVANTQISIEGKGYTKCTVGAFSSNTNQRRIYFYDSSNNLISSDTAIPTSGKTYDIPSATSYIAFQTSTQVTGAMYGFGTVTLS